MEAMLDDLDEKVDDSVPHIATKAQLKNELEDLYIIHSILQSEETFQRYFKKIYDLMKGCIEHQECREYPVHFKFYNKDEKVHKVELRHFLINLMLWHPFVHVNDIEFLNENFIMDGYQIIVSPEYEIDTWINEKIITVLRNFNVKETVINESVAEVIYDLQSISINFSLIMNLNFSFATFDDMYNKYPRIREIMECTFPENADPSDIENAVDKMLKEEVAIYKNDPGNPIGLILASKSGIKEKQFGEFTIAQGLKPNLEGTIMTVPIENSTLIRGLNRPSYLYIDASAARKSLILNKTVMGKAGNFGKLTLQLARTLGLSKTVSDCGTKHAVKITVKSKKALQKINRRYYKLNPEDDLSLIDAKRDTDLVGKTIYLRSPITCALGDKVCAKCFGRAAGLNYDIADGVAGFESEELTKELEQNVLSSKHLLTTKSEVLKFNDDFYKFFTMSSGEIYPLIDENEEIENIEDYAIYIPPDVLEKADEMDADTDYNTYIAGGTFYVVNTKEAGSMIPIIIQNEAKEIFLTDDCIELRKKGRGYIKFSDLSDDDKIFEINIANNELTKPLYDMMHLLNTNHDKNVVPDINEYAQEFLDLLVISGIKASMLSGEVVLNRLVRSLLPGKEYCRPDFTQDVLEPYDIITVKKALENNASPTLGLSVQYIKRQLMSDELVTTRNGTSYMDSLLVSRVPNLYSLYGKDAGKAKRAVSGIM